MLYQGQGRWKGTVKPYLFKSEIDDAGASKKWDGEHATGNIDGLALAGGLSYGLGERWGAFAWGLGSSGGDGSMNETQSSQNGSYNLTELRNIESGFQLVALGLTKRYFGRKERGFVMSSMFGATMTHLSLSQRILLRDKSTQAVYYDADMSLDAWHPGFLLGLQAGIPLGASFQLNPYAMFIASGIDNGLVFRDTDYRLTNVRVDTNPADPTASELTNHQALEVISGFASAGANLTYEPWGLSLNVTAPLLAPIFARSDGIDLTQLSVSWSFGDYRR